MRITVWKLERERTLGKGKEDKVNGTEKVW